MPRAVLPTAAALFLFLVTSHRSLHAQEKDISVPASVEAADTVRVFARVAGYLKAQKVDIGDRVKRGQVLAVLEASELEHQLMIDTAKVEQAKAQVAQARAHVSGAELAVELSRAAVAQAESAAKGAAANARLRETEFQRIKRLYETKAISEKEMNEAQQRHRAALEAEESARAGFTAAKVQVTAAVNKIEQAKADLLVCEAGIKVAQATRDKSQDQLGFATLTAPFDGVITSRGYAPGELIRTTDKAPIVTVQRTDTMRVVAAIPARQAAHIDSGSPAEVEIDAFPGKQFTAKVSRLGGALDPKARTMRVEIDLPNPMGRILAGMSARITIKAGK